MDGQLTFRLPRDLTRALEKEARRRGVARSVLVREAVQAYLAPEAPAGAVWERIAPYIGSVELDPGAADQDQLTRQLREHNWRE